MSSNYASNYVENASSETYDAVKQTEELSSLGDLLETFLLKNIEAWGQTPVSFPKYNLDACDMDDKNVELIKSILVLAYLLRKKLRKVFKTSLMLLRSSDKCFALFQSIPDDHYMFHYLVHLACLYEMVVYANTENYDIDDCVKPCILALTDGQHFFKQGGIKKLYSAAKNICVFYDALEESFGGNYSYGDILTPFARAVNTVERRYRYKDFEKQYKDKMNMEEDPKYIQKLQSLIFLNFPKFTLGYLSRNKDYTRDEEATSNTSYQMEHAFVDDGYSSVTLDESDEEVNEEIYVSLPSESSDINMDTTENEEANTIFVSELGDATLFIISESFCEKYIYLEENKRKLYCKSDIKVFCPEKITEEILFSKEMFDDLRQKGELYEHRALDEICAVGIEDIENFKKSIIILDTSSEEEDENDSFAELIKNHTMKCFRDFSSFQMRKMKFLLSEYTKKINLLKFLVTEVSKETKTEEIVGYTPKTKSHYQRKRRSSRNFTGAIPNVKTTVQMEIGRSEGIKGQNCALASPSTPDVSNLRLRAKERLFTPDGKREWRKTPVKRI